jgi:hypothetical protein
MVYQNVHRPFSQAPTSQPASPFAPRPFAGRRTALPARPGAGGVVHRAAAYPAAMADDDVGAITSFSAKEDDDETEEAHVARIKGDLLALTAFSGDVDFNCFGWALGSIAFEYPGDKLGTWKHRLRDDYDFLAADAAGATILLWGTVGDDDSKTVVNHASVLLTHAELLERVAGDYSDIDVDAESVKKIPDNPFWSSAMGAGFGVIVHPKDFFAGGDFGQIIAGMKKK